MSGKIVGSAVWFSGEMGAQSAAQVYFWSHGAVIYTLDFNNGWWYGTLKK